MDTVWVIHYHDGYSMQQTRYLAHCRNCAWQRFERQNRGCRVSAVVPAHPHLCPAESGSMQQTRKQEQSCNPGPRAYCEHRCAAETFLQPRPRSMRFEI